MSSTPLPARSPCSDSKALLGTSPMMCAGSLLISALWRDFHPWSRLAAALPLTSRRRQPLGFGSFARLAMASSAVDAVGR